MYSESEVREATLEYFGGDTKATDVWINKYALRDNDGNLLEKTPDDMHRRIAREIARIEKKKFKKPYDEEFIYNKLKNFETHIPQGSPMSAIGNPYQYMSLSNCFVTSIPADSYSAIMQTDEEFAQICKRRGGVGTALDNLRPNGTPTKNAARTSTGILPFLQRYSNTINEIGQNNRRGASLLSLSVHHPESVIVNETKTEDIVINPRMEHLGVKPIHTTTEYYDPNNLDFTSIKLDRTKVTGANISLKLTDAFFNAVERGTEFIQQWPLNVDNPKIVKFTDARKAWDKIVTAAWLTAEPGMLMWDNILKESLGYCYKKYGFEEQSTNPCCFACDSDVFVLTRDGIKEIKTITSKDEVWVQSAKTWTRTKGYFKSGRHPVYEVKFSSGHSLFVTSNHRFKIDCGAMYEIEEYLYDDYGTADAYNIQTFDLKEFCPTEPFAELSTLQDWCYRREGLTNNPDRSKGPATDYVVEYRYVGEKEVGCIEVPEYHEFVANGVISGNSEIPLPPYDSCRLYTINLFSFVRDAFTKDAYFDYKSYYNECRLAARLMDDMVDIEIELIDRILKKIKSDPEDTEIKSREMSLWKKIRAMAEKGRRTGIGPTALGDTLAALNSKYGSDESIEIIDKIYKTLKFGCYRGSVEVSKEIGPFMIFNAELEQDNPFLNRIKEETLDLGDEIISGAELYSEIQKYGRRNIMLLTTAPTGSVSILAKIGKYHDTSSGIEPAIFLEYTRKIKIMPGMDVSIDSVDQDGNKWHHYKVNHSGLKLWKDVSGLSDIKKSPYWGATAEDIDWVQRVKLQGVAQKHIDHSISSTINLPEDVSVEEVKRIYEAAWKAGLKGITVYRAGCRSGVMVQDNNGSVDYNKRPKDLPASIYHFTYKSQPYFVLVGLLNGEPYEIFAGKNGVMDKKYTTGTIHKVKRGKYQLICDGQVILDSITSYDEPNEEALTRMTSECLRHKVPIQFTVHQLEKVEGDMYCLAKSMARALKKYVPENVKVTGDECKGCGSTGLVRQEGCIKCLDCGWSKC